MTTIAPALVAIALMFSGPGLGALQEDSSVQADTDRHCVYEIVEVAADLELVMAPERCFGTFAEAALYLSSGLIRLPYDTPTSILESQSAGVQRLANFTIGIHYDYYNGGGSSISVSGSSCVGGWWNTPTWFDNRESSAFNGCYRLRHYDGPNKGGSFQSTTGVGDTDNLSTLDNRVESVSYHGS
jgi:hypothetical protein